MTPKFDDFTFDKFEKIYYVAFLSYCILILNCLSNDMYKNCVFNSYPQFSFNLFVMMCTVYVMNYGYIRRVYCETFYFYLLSIFLNSCGCIVLYLTVAFQFMTILCHESEILHD